MPHELLRTRLAGAAFVVASALALLLAQGQDIALGGRDSLGSRAGVIAGGLAAVSFAAAYLAPGSAAPGADLHRPPLKRILALVALASGVGLSAYLIVIAVAQVFQIGFRGLTIDPLGGAALAGFAAAVASYAAASFGPRVTGSSIASLSVSLLFMGTLASMVSSPDASWWQLHFSQLGNTAGVTGYRFNLALIMTGLLLTVLADYIAHSFARGLRVREVDSVKTPRTIAWIFTGIGVCMMTAGWVPDATNFAVHVGAASGMVVFFGALTFVVLRDVPDLPREMVAFTYVVIAGIIVAVLLWIPVGYYNLTGMELVSAGLLFSWLIEFTRSAESYAGSPRREAVDASTQRKASAPAGSPARRSPGRRRTR
ncbi:DUF998 domain-containing protein [Microbacterium stercoris]|uniref:DUF998 domain-containing protein n=1 Tax=Microbacterium stercoris TaxID=2820289 RepID=A0A939QQW1_9MICO|nr:DUF998 domain-containing protein [Microbacterium stercoris]MBO3662996.1 DUF998 domain-containing protein [Microbacterium stercoris]